MTASRQPTPCTWGSFASMQERNLWKTACGESFTFETGTPTTNHFEFCPYCGKKIAETTTLPPGAIEGVIVRGHITRFSEKPEWTAILLPWPAPELPDADANAYYVRGADGKFREYYGHASPPGKQVFTEYTHPE